MDAGELGCSAIYWEQRSKIAFDPKTRNRRRFVIALTCLACLRNAAPSNRPSLSTVRSSVEWRNRADVSMVVVQLHPQQQEQSRIEHQGPAQYGVDKNRKICFSGSGSVTIDPAHGSGPHSGQWYDRYWPIRISHFAWGSTTAAYIRTSGTAALKCRRARRVRKAASLSQPPGLFCSLRGEVGVVFGSQLRSCYSRVQCGGRKVCALLTLPSFELGEAGPEPRHIPGT
jgi:hypothetical protein